MPEVRPSRRLDQPRVARRFSVDIDPEAFGRFSENLARFLGTGKFLFWQTLLVLIWITLNLFAVRFRWDPYPFILLNLAFSTQAAYAAPLILLAQNRQDDRDRITVEEDRARASQTKADTEFLARELAALRVAIGEIATRDYLRGELDRLRIDLEDAAAGKPKREKPSAKSGKPIPKAATKPAPKAVAKAPDPEPAKPSDTPSDKPSDKPPDKPSDKAREQAQDAGRGQARESAKEPGKDAGRGQAKESAKESAGEPGKDGSKGGGQVSAAGRQRPAESPPKSTTDKDDRSDPATTGAG